MSMNLKEVARKAKVSTATVSRVLNNVEVVRQSTRARVMKAISDLNYHPNLHARSLAVGKTRTLGMIVSNMENPFFLDVFRHVEADAHAHGYEVVVANTDYRPEQLLSSFRMMMGRRVAGVAVIVSEMEPAIVEEMSASNLPVIFYDVGTAGNNITKIRVNYRRGIEKVVNYLHSLGHERMAFIGHHTQLEPLNERRRCFFQAVEKLGSRVEVQTFFGNDGLDGGRQAAREMLASNFRPSALICANDFMAVGLLRELRDHDIRVPEDMSVTGFDNIKLSEYCYPALTTVHIPRDTIGHVVFETLVPESNSNPLEGGREIVIDPEFVLRESTGPARRGVTA